MKFTTSLLLAPLAAAFPASVLDQVAQDPALAARAAEIMETAKRQEGADGATAIFEANPTFSEEQLIDVGPGSGHEWQAPRQNDLRGPCPGLNAFANHGFLRKLLECTVKKTKPNNAQHETDMPRFLNSSMPRLPSSVWAQFSLPSSPSLVQVSMAMVYRGRSTEHHHSVLVDHSHDSATASADRTTSKLAHEDAFTSPPANR